jgi:hypothetical protein
MMGFRRVVGVLLHCWSFLFQPFCEGSGFDCDLAENFC